MSRESRADRVPVVFAELKGLDSKAVIFNGWAGVFPRR